MGVGLCIGLLQGGIIAFLALPPFIVTLGGYYIWKSGILIVTAGKSIFISSNDTVQVHRARIHTTPSRAT